MNPIAIRRPAQANRLFACPRCDDRGFIDPAGGLRQTGYGWTAKEVFDRAIACTCAAGATFASQQMEWHKPILPRPDAPPAQRNREKRNRAPFVIPDELARKFELTAVEPPKKPLPPMPERTITQADIQAELERKKRLCESSEPSCSATGDGNTEEQGGSE